MRYVAFLRGVNISGRVLKMDALRKHFEEIGYTDVETVIASGNVIFSARAGTDAALAKKIEARLHKAMGSPVRTFVRTGAEITELAQFEPFSAAKRKAAKVLLAGFIDTPLTKVAEKTLLSYCSPTDELKARGRELFWLAYLGQGASPLLRVPMEKQLGCLISWRNMNTVQRIADKLAKP
jgi:uncharacterized protein (DUF1697 family)